MIHSMFNKRTAEEIFDSFEPWPKHLHPCWSIPTDITKESNSPSNQLSSAFRSWLIASQRWKEPAVNEAGTANTPRGS